MHQKVELLATWDADVEAADRLDRPNPEPESMCEVTFWGNT